MYRRHRTTTGIRGLAAEGPRPVSEPRLATPSQGGEAAGDRRWTGLRLLAVALAALLVWALAPQPAGAFHKFPKWQCGYHWEQGKWHRKQLIKCQAQRKGLSGAKAINVANCESHLDPNAKGGGGLYLGLFQQHKGYWPERARSAGFAGCSAFNGRANACVSLAMAKRSGWTSHWPVCGS
jgi:hypothetical protein